MLKDGEKVYKWCLFFLVKYCGDMELWGYVVFNVVKDYMGWFVVLVFGLCDVVFVFMMDEMLSGEEVDWVVGFFLVLFFEMMGGVEE